MAGLAKRPFVLIVRDGWGENPHPEMDSYNAVKLAKHPVDDRLMREGEHVIDTEAGRAQNRRVEVAIYASEAYRNQVKAQNP